MSSVSIQADGNVSTEYLQQVLEEKGYDVTEKKGMISLVLSRSYLSGFIQEINDDALRTGRPFLLASSSESLSWLGPLVIPNETACWCCLAYRLKNNDAEFRQSVTRRRRDPLSYAVPRTPNEREIIDLLVEEVGLFFDGKARLKNSLVSFEETVGRSTSHHIVKRPACKACGRMTDRPPSDGINKIQSLDPENTNRIRFVSADKTFNRFAHHISPITGIVHRLTPDFSEADTPLHSHSAVYALPKRLDEANGGALLVASSGKGTTHCESKTSALCEALEGYSRMFQGEGIRISGVYEDLHDCAVHPASFLLYSQQQYDCREIINKVAKDIRERIPEPFDESDEISWTPYWSITNEAMKYLPTAFSFDRFPGPGRNCFYSDSNGNAAGNTLAECITEGLLEVVERDSIALWWYNCGTVPAVDIDSFDDTFLSETKAYYTKLGFEMAVLDISTDLNIPVFGAIVRSRKAEEVVYFGFGAYPDVKTAITRAVAELNQNLKWMVLRAGAENGKSFGRKAEVFAGFKGGLNSLYSPAEMRDSDFYRHSGVLHDKGNANKLIYCINALKTHGLEVLVLDQTRSDVGLPVVKVVIPGLRHHWKRFAPGRLYDVPAKIGWTEVVKDEQELNPFTFLF